eukprot:1846198-Prymnesium_polylepis.1
MRLGPFGALSPERENRPNTARAKTVSRFDAVYRILIRGRGTAEARASGRQHVAYQGKAKVEHGKAIISC